LTDGTRETNVCARAESAAAYLDGELDSHESAAFEEHARACGKCWATVAEQRRLLCLLDHAFEPRGASRGLELPKDFARVVTARAQNDICGLRSREERAFSLKLSLALAALAALLLGASAGDDSLAPLRSAASAASGVVEIVGRALYDATAGGGVILRAIGGRFAAGPQPLDALYLILFGGALLLLLRLIRGYHRAR